MTVTEASSQLPAARSDTATGKDRNPYIDRLRGLAVGIVVVSHASGYIPLVLDPLPEWFIIHLVRNSYYGVAIFFAISGYLITRRAILASSRYSFKAFLLRFYSQRAGRIFPPLILMVGAGLALSAMGVAGFVISSACPIPTMLAYIATFRFNWFIVAYGSPGPRTWDVLWSLSVEEVFYLSYPLLFGILRVRTLIMCVLVIIVVCGPIRRYMLAPSDLYSFFGTFDMVAVGALAAFGRNSSVLRAIPARLGRLIGAVAIATVYLWEDENKVIVAGPTLIALAGAFYLLYADDVPRKHNQIQRMAEFLGRASYELYLSHMFFLIAINHWIRSMDYASWPRENVVELSYFSLCAFLMLASVFSDFVRRHYSEPLNVLIRRTADASKSLLQPMATGE